MRRVVVAAGIALGTGSAAVVFSGAASAAPQRAEPAQPVPHTAPARPARAHGQAMRTAGPHPSAATPQHRSAQRTAGRSVSVDLPALPLLQGRSFAVSQDTIARRATEYVDAGGDPTDTARFFYGDLAVSSLGALADPATTPGQARLELGNLAASGYLGGLWLRDNLFDGGAPAQPTEPAAGLTYSRIGVRLFDALASVLMQAAGMGTPVVRGLAHASVPVLLTLYGYNRGYLEVLLENPPPGMTADPGTLGCDGFLDCESSAFPVEIATRYDAVLDDLHSPPSPAWAEMSAWTALLQRATGAGRFVWELIAGRGAFSPASYEALVELSSVYLMISKAAVLSSMSAYADRDTGLGRSSLRLQAGLWMWSGSYFAGLASGARAGTAPKILLD